MYNNWVDSRKPNSYFYIFYLNILQIASTRSRKQIEFSEIDDSIKNAIFNQVYSKEFEVSSAG